MTRWARLLAYCPALLGVCLHTELIGRVWVLWLTSKGSRTRVERANRITRGWNVTLTHLTMTLFDARLDVRGDLPAGRFIVVSNHQSAADVAILPWVLRRLNLKFVAKEKCGRHTPSRPVVATAAYSPPRMCLPPAGIRT